MVILRNLDMIASGVTLCTCSSNRYAANPQCRCGVANGCEAHPSYSNLHVECGANSTRVTPYTRARQIRHGFNTRVVILRAFVCR